MHTQELVTILHLTAPAEVGGLETVVLQLSEGLRARGRRVVLGTILDAHGEAEGLPRRATAVGLEVARVVVPHRAYFREYRALSRLIADVAPDVVHTHGYRADIIGGLAARRAQIPWIATAHGFVGGGVRARLYEWLQVRLLRRATRVIAVSRPVRERLIRAGVREERAALIINAWTPKTVFDRAEARRRLGIPGNGFVVGWVGRLTPEKGADVFLEGLARIRSLPWCASVIGEGSDRQVLERQAQSLGIADRVRWHGLVPHAAALYSAFDAWVLSSRTEGTPIALFEAMGARVPVIASEVGGVPGVVSSSEAILVPPEHPEALAGALRMMIEDPARAADRATAAHHRLQTEFAHEPWVDAHIELYRKAMVVR